MTRDGEHDPADVDAEPLRDPDAAGDAERARADETARASATRRAEVDEVDPGDGVRDDADALEDDAPARVERRSDVVIVTLVFVVLYGYDLLEAIANLQGLPAIYAAAGIEGVPWAVLVAGVAAPPLAFAAASALARGRRLAARAGILLVGLGVSAQLALLLEELARRAAVAAFGG